MRQIVVDRLLLAPKLREQDARARRGRGLIHQVAHQSFAFQTLRLFPQEKPQSFQERETLMRYPVTENNGSANNLRRSVTWAFGPRIGMKSL